MMEGNIIKFITMMRVSSSLKAIHSCDFQKLVKIQKLQMSMSLSMLNENSQGLYFV